MKQRIAVWNCTITHAQELLVNRSSNLKMRDCSCQNPEAIPQVRASLASFPLVQKSLFFHHRKSSNHLYSIWGLNKILWFCSPGIALSWNAFFCLSVDLWLFCICEKKTSVAVSLVSSVWALRWEWCCLSGEVLKKASNVQVVKCKKISGGLWSKCMTKMKKNGRNKQWQREHIRWACSAIFLSYRLMVILGSYFW